MKLSVSLPDDDIAIIDDYARTAGLSSRSAALHHAVRMLRLPTLEDDYSAAWQAWQSEGEDAVWAAAVADGVDDAAR